MNSQMLLDKLNNDSISNEELILGLNAENHHVIGLTFYKIIDRKYCDEEIISRLVQLSSLLKDRNFYGPYQYSHIAVSALYLTEHEEAISKYHEIFEGMNEDDKFFIDDFIKGMKEGEGVAQG
ncbi:MAG: hypothetical protein FWF88_06240 [Peptococcaceae bacterium]|nr:hypothetical protein [Peptococcaceae bacterium]